jgi:probable rRNA maturation factor
VGLQEPTGKAISMSIFDIELVNQTDSAVDENRLFSTASFALAYLRMNPDTALSIALVTLAEMEELHIQHMDEPGPTDVLSFEMDELRVPAEGETAEPGILGDVVLCPDFAAKQAAENNQDTASELDLLLVHGILHLLGHDHAEPEEHKVMFGLQGDILAALNKTRGA